MKRGAALRQAGLASAFFLALLAGERATAATIRFNVPSGDWLTPGNWDLSRIPVSNDQTYIENGAAVTLAGTAATSTLYIGNASAGGSLTINSGGALSLFGFRSNGDLTVNGTGASLSTTSTTTYIGELAPGTLTIQNGGYYNSQGAVTISNGFTGTATVTGVGSRWDAAILGVGAAGSATGTLNILAGGVVTSTTSNVSANGGTGLAIVDGTGSRWDAGSLTVGKNQPGTVTVRNGAVLNATSATIGFTSAFGSTVNVTGPGTQFNVNGSMSLTGFVVQGVGSKVIVSNGAALNVTGTLTTDLQQELNIGGGGLGATVTAGTIANSGNIVFDFTDSATFSATVNGTGNMTKNNTGTLTLAGVNNSTTAMFVNAGTVRATTPQSLSSGGVNVNNAGNLTLANDNNTFFQTSAGAGVTVKLNNTNVMLTSDRLTPGPATTHSVGILLLAPGTVNMQAGSNVTSGTAGFVFSTMSYSSAGNSTFNVGANARLSIDSYINGNVARVYTKTGVGILALGANTSAQQTDSYVVNNGTLQETFDNGLTGAWPVTVNANAANTTATYELDYISHSIGALTLGGAGGTSTSRNNVDSKDSVLTLNGNLTYDATGNPLGSLVQGALNFNGATRNVIVGDSTNADSDLTITSDVLGGAFNKTGAGTLTLAGNNYNSGAINASAGTLVATGHANATGGTTLTLSGAALKLAYDTNVAPVASVTVSANTAITLDRATPGAGTNVTFPALTMGAQTVTVTKGSNVTGGAGGVTFSSTKLSGNSTFNVGSGTQLALGAVANGTSTGSLTKLGSGQLLLTGTSTYTGTTTVNEGKFSLVGTAVSDVTVAPGATFASGNNTTAALGSHPTLGYLTINSNAADGGILAPGDTGGTGLTSIGKLNLKGNLFLGTSSTASEARLQLELGGGTAGTQYDQISITDGVSLLRVRLELSFVNGFRPGADTNYFLIVGGDGVLGTFSNQLAPSAQSGGLPSITFDNQEFAISYTANAAQGTLTGGHDIALHAVPEPSSLALVLGAGLLLPWRRRRA